MKYARLNGGVVEDIALKQPVIKTFVPEDGWEEIPDEVHAGFIKGDDGTFSAPPPPPVPPRTIGEVKAEANRRILAIAPEWKQRNMIAFGVEAIRDHGTDVSAWPAELQAMNTTIQVIWDAIKAIRAKSGEIEAMDPIPDDLEDNSYWP